MTSFDVENSLDQAFSRHAPLDAFFHPHKIAVIGASEEQGSVGRTLLWNLLKAPFEGTVFPVNPKHASLLGAQCYASIGQVPDKVDLAVIATPAATVPSVIADCARAGVRAAVVISAGFKETGPSGAALEQAVLAEARKHDLRIIGPNCLGLMNPHTGLNATFASEIARPGSVAFISQSGALCTAILDWSQREMVGFSAFVSVGSMLDVGWGDLIQYLGDDSKTQSIIIYMESVGDARSFLSAAREVALAKPIIVIKPGRTEAAAHAAASHTGSLTGSDEVLDAAFRRCGVLRVNTIAELFYASEALGKQPRPKGPRLAIVTNAGGPGVLATDALLARGGKLAQLSEKTMNELNEFLPRHWSHGNPVDILGDAPPERWEKAVRAVAADPNADGLLVVLAPQGMTDPLAVAHKLENFAHLRGKPVIASWMGGPMVEPGERVLNIAGIPTFSFPDSAAQVFQSMWSYSENLQSLYETPALVEESEAGNTPGAGRENVDAIIRQAREHSRTLLTEAESKRVLAAYGIPVVETSVASTEDEAVAEAARIGYPVALKLHSETITHKTDVGGVRLNLKTPDAVREAWKAIQAGVPAADFLGVAVQPMIKLEGYELILGSSIDSQFGPVVLFGGGGQLVEVYKDHALALPPLNTTLARRLMEQTRIFTALGGVRGRKPVDLAALEHVLVRFSRLVAEQRWIKEIDINPLLASPEKLVALDARIVLHPPETREQDLPRLAIRPYPEQFVKPFIFENATEVLIRPIRPEDEPMLAAFHATLSERSVYLRYFHMIPLDTRIAHERLTRICFIDYDREIVLVAQRDKEILAVGRLTKAHHANEAEFALLISDKFQGHGLGTELLKRLVEIARIEGLDRVTADILGENRQMIEICRLLGFRLKHSMGEGVVKAELEIK